MSEMETGTLKNAVRRYGFVMNRFCSVAAILLVFGTPAFCWGIQLTLPARAYQGDFFVGRSKPPVSIFVDGKSVQVSSKGYFAVGVPRDRKKDLIVVAADGEKKVSETILIMAYPWSVQCINGLPHQYIDPSLEARKKIKKDNQRVLTRRKGISYSHPLFLDDGFSAPVDGPMTSVFGSQRILNGKSKSPHRGVDFAAAEGASVFSPADGIVSLAATGMYLMGNVLMIDHGLGVQSIFIHLDRVLVREGDQVQKGKPVARVGKTGRATGPHLHWGVSVGSTVVDPVRLLNGIYGVP